MNTMVLNIINLNEGRIHYDQATVHVLLHCLNKDGLIIAFEKKNTDKLSLFNNTTVFHAQIRSHRPFRAHLNAIEIKKCITSDQIISTINYQTEAKVTYSDKSLACLAQRQST